MHTGYLIANCIKYLIKFVNFKFPTRNSIITVISFLHNCSVYLTMLWFRIRAQTHNPIKTKEERGVHHLFMVVTVWLQQANCEWSLLVLSVCLLQIVYSIDMQCSTLNTFDIRKLCISISPLGQAPQGVLNRVCYFWFYAPWLLWNSETRRLNP